MRSSPWKRVGILWVVASALVACSGGVGSPDGRGPSASGGPVSAVITIQDFTFSPVNLEVSPGQTVTVRNLDPVPHTVTSQSAPDTYVPGAVASVSFDTGAFTGEQTFTIPASAPPGTVVPYFCTVHKAGMRNDAQLTIR
ncbi:MAG: plastocyanin/azurin family copper-binding protein [Myxococcaceae bacterium]|nr:plastocyanin/azurin family copper-binding protein [Myxococcaceae bacterium]MCI0670140.1 plastocyanin/azurin family copper-binding protein [Myxococcaceae bacterium]